MPARVLIIEDNEQNMYLISYLLESQGFTIFSSFSGNEALSIVQSCNPDLIILDIQLPDTDGYTIARSLRQLDFLQKIPIVAVSSFAMPGDREKAFEAGVTGYIEKPIDPDKFISQLEDFMSEKRS